MNGWEEAKQLIEYRLQENHLEVVKCVECLERIEKRLIKLEERTSIRAMVFGAIAGSIPGASAIIYAMFR